jgi:cytoskeletal protein CcmA (bactofilin family)
MFGQKGSAPGASQGSAAADPVAPARGGKGALTILAQGCVIEGAISADGDIQVDGTIIGPVRCATLNVGQTGEVRGDVTAEAVTVRGTVSGAIGARLVQLAASARVEGDVTHAQLVIEAGAAFEGRSRRQAPEPAALPAPKS